MKKILIISLILVISLLIHAQDEYRDLFDDLSADLNETPVDDTENNKDKKLLGRDVKFTIMLTGDHGFEFHIPLIPDYMDFDGYIKSPKVINDFGIEIAVKNLKLITHWEFNLILNGWGDWSKFLEIIPLENYISWSPWKFTFGLGFQKYNWGTADVINPTDNINLKDIREPFNPRKISVFSLYIGFFPVNFMSIEALYIPFYLMPPFSLTELFEDAFGSELEPTFQNVINPEFFGLGGKLSFFLKHADFSFSYLTKVEPYYSLDLDLEYVYDPSSDNHIYSASEVEMLHRRLHYIGADFRTNVGIFGLWLEVCYSLSEDYLMQNYDIRNHQLSWTAGFDFNYGPNSDFYCNIQYFGYFNPFYDQDFYRDYDDGLPEANEVKSYYREFYYRSLTDVLGGVTEGLLNGLSIQMKWPVLKSKLVPTLELLYSIPAIYNTDREARYGNLYIKPELEINPMEAFYILIGADLFFSWHTLEGNLDIDESNITGANYENTNFFIEVRYKWGIDLLK